MRAHSKKAASYQTGRDFSPECNPVSILVLDFPASASRAVRYTFLLFKPPGVWYFVIAALAA